MPTLMILWLGLFLAVMAGVFVAMMAAFALVALIERLRG